MALTDAEALGLGRAIEALPIGVAVAIIPNIDRHGSPWYTVMWFDDSGGMAEANLHVECGAYWNYYAAELEQALRNAPIP